MTKGEDVKTEVPIFCCGQRTVAWLDKVLNVWRCGRCGAKVRVVT